MAAAVGGAGGDAGTERSRHLAAAEDPCGAVPDRVRGSWKLRIEN